MPSPTQGTMSKSHAKGAKKSKIVTLKLSSTLLAKYAPTPVAAETQAGTDSEGKPGELEEASIPVEAPAEQTSVDAVGDANGASTPAARAYNPLDPTSIEAAKRKGIPGPKPGMKRTASQLDLNGTPKARGKPGPKKKPRLGENGEGPTGTGPPGPKLGPKANQGAINACLRALDRSGAPCRKWARKPFTVKSFTGYQWNTGVFATIRKPESFPGDVKSDSSSAGEVKANVDSSAVASQKSSSGDNNDTAGTPLLQPQQPNGIASSPVPSAIAAAS